MLSGLVAPERTATGVDKVIISTIAICFILSGLSFTRRAAWARSGLVRIDQNGLWDRRVSTTIIPWSVVIDVTPVRLNKTPYVVLRLRPAYETSRAFQANTTISYRFRRFFGYLGVYVRSDDLRCNFNDLLSACLGELHSFRSRQLDEALSVEDEVADPSEAELARARQRSPLLTFVVIGVLVCIFLAEFSSVPASSDGFGLSPTGLHRMGALDRYGIAHHEYWRLATAPALHASFGHLIANCVALLLAGYLLEPVVGAKAFGAIYVLCALIGGLTSLWLNPASVVSVGASGGIVGLMTFAFSWGFTYPPGAMRSAFLIGSGRVLFPTLAALAMNGSAHVDQAAHLGGGIAGLAIAVLSAHLRRFAFDGKPACSESVEAGRSR